MKLCDFCDHCGRTEKGEQVCTKRLIYVGDLESYYPCTDFATSVERWIRVALMGLVVFLVIVSALIAIF